MGPYRTPGGSIPVIDPRITKAIEEGLRLKDAKIAKEKETIAAWVDSDLFEEITKRTARGGSDAVFYASQSYVFRHLDYLPVRQGMEYALSLIQQIPGLTPKIGSNNLHEPYLTVTWDRYF